MSNRFQERPPTRVQTVLLTKERFPTRARAAKWVRDHDFRADKIDETDNGFRFRQFPPTQCRERSFRTIRLDNGVSAVICRPRNAQSVNTPAIIFPDDKLTRLEAMIDDQSLDLCSMALNVPTFELRTVGGKAKLSKDNRRELLMALRQGDVIELELDAVTFQQPRGVPSPLPVKLRKLANANFVRFRDRDLPRFAKSFNGKPFLRDHGRGDLLKRGGTITKSDLRETDKQFQLSQHIHLVKPWAVEAALDGTLQTFSIGWDASTPGFRGLRNAVHCTVCGKKLFSHDCPHMPGDVAKVANDSEPVIVEAEFRDPQGAETSAVAFPAVQGTNVESIAPTE